MKNIICLIIISILSLASIQCAWAKENASKSYKISVIIPPIIGSTIQETPSSVAPRNKNNSDISFQKDTRGSNEVTIKTIVMK